MDSSERKSMKRRVIWFSLLMLTLIFLFTILNPRFISVNNLTTILRNATPVGFAALGLTFVMVVQKFDLSFEGTISFGAMAVAYFISIEFSPWLAVPLGMLFGVSIGFVNGFAISYLRMPDIVTTIAIGTIFSGASYLFSNGKDIFRNFISSGILSLNNGKILSASYTTILLVFVAIAAYFFLDRTRWGRSFYAVGENPVTAKYSGINVKAYVAAAFVISSVLMIFTSTILVSAGGKGEIGAGEGYLLASYAAVLLGTSIFLRPGVLPTIAGVLFIAIINNGLTLAGVENLAHNAIISVILIVGILAFDKRAGHNFKRRLIDQFNSIFTINRRSIKQESR